MDLGSVFRAAVSMAGLTILVACGAARAADGPESEPASASAASPAEGADALQEVVVTANKRQESTQQPNPLRK